MAGVGEYDVGSTTIAVHLALNLSKSYGNWGKNKPGPANVSQPFNIRSSGSRFIGSRHAPQSLERQALRGLRSWAAAMVVLSYSSCAGSEPELVQELQDAVEESPRLDGCRIRGADLTDVPDGTGQLLILKGDIAEAMQRPLIDALAVSVMHKTPRWQEWLQDSSNNINVRELAVATTSSQHGEDHFAAGVEKFRAAMSSDRNDVYRSAYESFCEAVRHDAGSRKYAYWRLLTILQLGDEDRALDHCGVLKTRNLKLNVATLRTMERVHGRRRARFMELIRELQLSELPE